MVFKIGDHVMVLDENMSGVVKNIVGTSISIETEDGFLLDFKSDELIKDTSKSILKKARISNTAISEKEQPTRKQQKRIKAKDRFEPTMEVDLHINQLVKSSRGMSNHDMLTLQLDTARHKLDWAISKRIQKIVFIHGVGEGVLKIELEYLFGRYNNIKFYDANYQKYGLGATEVYVYQNV
ncbi:DNA mismatch repair protein MutS [Thalassobellus suaedae]|uniref:DNA mismatch repair protein MutS n=1 Tax=Thalassobellus suaedae TaxID=3074124 RepID=A0ABY9Y1E8_9FLAO|nr:DNA mismatch repair protein MutS [Flavobacteriaceae bacterium HL-DH10]